MLEGYELIGQFLSPTLDNSGFVKRFIIRDEKGACVISEDQWNKMILDQKK